VISGEEADGADYDDWAGFEAAHIFPLAREDIWKECNFGNWITIPPAKEKAGAINSVQNGMLLTSTLHQRFDTYAFSVNPDVCMPNITLSVNVANDYLRITTRSYSSYPVGRISPASISIKRSLIILSDPLMSSYAGTSSRQS